MVADLGIVKDTLVGFDPVVIEYLRSKLVVVIVFCECAHRLFDGRQIIFRQVTRVSTRIGQYLVFFIQRLRQTQRVFG